MKNILLLFAGLLLAITVQAQAPGTVKSATRISAKAGSLGVSPNWKVVGRSAVSYPDLDGDGIREMAFSALDAQANSEAVFIVKINSSGGVKPGNPIVISKSTSPLNSFNTKYPGYASASRIGAALTMLKDLNGNGVDELVASDPTNSRLYILFMNATGSADSVVLIENGLNGFSLASGHTNFGAAVSRIGDIDGDGTEDLASYARTSDKSGALYIMFMKNNGSVRKIVVLRGGSGGIGPLTPDYYFGFTPCPIGDLDQDGTPDILVGAAPTSNGSRGEFWTLFMKSDGTVRNYRITKPNTPSFPDTVSVQTGFGTIMASIGDIDGDSVADIAVGGGGFLESMGQSFGRVYILFMKRDGSPKASQIIDRNIGNLSLPIDTLAYFGYSVFGAGDFNKDNIFDLGVGAPNSFEGTTPPPPGPLNSTGAIYMLALNGIPITTGIGDVLHNLTDSYFLYPNPTSDYIRIRSRKPLATALQVRLLDAAGRTVKLASGEGTATLEIEVAHLPAGMYSIELSNGKEVQYGKFIKN